MACHALAARILGQSRTGRRSARMARSPDGAAPAVDAVARTHVATVTAKAAIGATTDGGAGPTRGAAIGVRRTGPGRSPAQTPVATVAMAGVA